MIGKQVGNYRIVSKLGEGGMASVFEAVNEQIGKRVAIKVLHAEHAENKQIAQRFINEARAINIVDHPGVVQITEFGETPDGTAYIVMELLKGETLNARLKSQGGRMPIPDALSLSRQIASALAAAHGKEIIHRDLKPDNIMLVKDSAFPGGERTKLLDFGIAKLKLEYQGSGDQVQTRAGVMMGTPLYMSPEQCRNAGDVDDKADVYSLGVMLYRMLAGRPPFTAPGTGELMAMHIYMQPPSLNETAPGLPEGLVKVVHSMLAKKREERPSMAQVVAELEKITVRMSAMNPAVAAPGPPAGLSALPPAPMTDDMATVVSDSKPPTPAPVTTPPPGTMVAPPPGGGRRVGVIAAVVVVLLGAGGVGYWRWQVAKNASKPPVENIPPKVVEPPKPAPKLVRWHIESDPPGAEIYRLDKNAKIGETPLRSEHPEEAAKIELELRLANHTPYKLTVDGDKDSEPALIKLVPEKKGKGPKKPKGKAKAAPAP